MTTPTNAPLTPNGYVRKVLLSDETILHQTRLHIVIFFKPMLLAVFIFLVVSIIPKSIDIVMGKFSNSPVPLVTPVWPFLVAATIIVFSILLVPYMRRTHSEFAVTDIRVILKTGLLRQTSLDLQWKSIGGVSVDQTLFGRVFNYGTIGVHGTSAGQKFPMVSSPFAFKRAVEEMIQKNASGNANK